MEIAARQSVGKGVNGHKGPRKPSPTAYRVVKGEVFKDRFGDRLVYLSPRGVKGFFTRDTNEFVPCEARLRLLAAGKFQIPH